MPFPSEAAVRETYDMAVEIAEPQLRYPARDSTYLLFMALKRFRAEARGKRFVAQPREAREGILHGYSHADDRIGTDYLPDDWEIHVRENYVVMSTDGKLVFPAVLTGQDPRISPVGIMTRGLCQYPERSRYGYFDVSWRFVNSANTNEPIAVLGAYPGMPDRAVELGHVALDEAELEALFEVYGERLKSTTRGIMGRYCLRLTESGLEFLNQVLGAIDEFSATKF